MTTALRGRPAPVADPWHALWAMMVGFFMILVDATIVSVANPSIMTALGTGYDAVIWVTSAYLLGFAVPLLIAGRLGDRYGPKNLYLIGLLVFTAASLWCGLSGTIGMLIAARVVQGVGAALLTPQTLSTITRIFPAERRGVAMSVWGATAGVATLVGPLAGGFLVDGLGWQWIFFVNVPIGIIGLGLAFWLVPDLPTENRGFDLIGVVLSGVGMFMVVFALQEGQSHHWAPWVWGTLAGGVGVFAAFVFWQQANRNEPLVPLGIFRDRDFSLSALGVATIGFVVTGMILPLMFYAQAVCGLSPTRSALLTAPMAIATGVLAPWVGRLVDRYHPRPIIGFGFSTVGDRADVVVGRDDTDHADLANRVAADGDWDRYGVHLVAVGGDRDARSGVECRGRGFRCVQRHPAGGFGAGQRQHGCLHDDTDQRRDAACRRRADRGAGQSRSCRGSCTNRSRPRCRSRFCCPRSSPCSEWWPRCSCSASAARTRRNRGPRRRSTSTGTTTVTWSTTTTMSNSPWCMTSMPGSPRPRRRARAFVGTSAPVAPVVDTVVEPVGDESDTEPIPEVVPPLPAAPAFERLPAPRRARRDAGRPGGAARPSTRARAQPVRLSRRRATAETVG